MHVSMWLSLSCVLFNFFVTHAIDYTPELQIQSGKIRGFVETLTNRAKVRKYLGVPYATAKRFENPVPPQNLTDVKDRISFGKVCYHFERNSPFGYKFKDMSEDCLNLNVYVPDKQTNNKLPVMVWIHGGGFLANSNRISDGSYLATIGEVIVVIINYRLGLLGFLHGKDYNLTGNYGLYDQLEALKWVKKNIANFGGDPTKVTIFGNSAGGASVSILSLSPLAKGLFRYAIMQSGFVTSPYGYTHYQTKSVVTNYFKEKLNCTGPNVNDCLKAIPPKSLTNVTLLTLRALITPVIDGKLLLDTPEALLRKSGHALNPQSTLIGVADDDGSCFTDAIPALSNMGYLFERPPNDQNKLINKVKEFFWIAKLKPGNPVFTQAVMCKYANHTDVTNIAKNQRVILDVLKDAFFVAPAIVHANDYVQRGIKTFFYEVKYGLPMSNYFKVPTVLNAYHETEKFMVFGFSMKDTKTKCSIGSKLSREVMIMWSNFAKTGDPNTPNKLNFDLKWPQYNMAKQKYLVIKPKMEVKTKLRPDYVAFWNKTAPWLMKTSAPKLCKLPGNSSIVSPPIPPKPKQDHIGLF